MGFCKSSSCDAIRLAFCVLAFSGTLLGTIIGGASELLSGTGLSLSKLVSQSGGNTWGSGFGCAVAGVILQFLALVLTTIHFCCGCVHGSEKIPKSNRGIVSSSLPEALVNTH